jgi:hypothetical protein
MVTEQVPETIIAGDSVAWVRELADYPAGVWSLTYLFSNAVQSFTIAAAADGVLHSAAVSAATTGAYTAGRYRWHARVTNGTDVFTVENGWLEVKPNPAGSNVDWRSHARKMLDAIEATLESKATREQLDLLSYSIGGEVSLTRDREQLLKLRAQYTVELANEEGSAKLKKRNVYVRFSNR